MKSFAGAALLVLFCAVAPAQQNPPPGQPAVSELAPQYGQNPLVSEGDRWYLRRQEGRVGLKASAGPINQAIALYDKATADPHYVEARWKLMRALYFKGVYTGLDEEARKAVFEKARRIADDSIVILDSSVEDRGIKGMVEAGPEFLAGNLKQRGDAAPSFYWASTCYGQWALSVGAVESARKGVADKIRDWGATVVAINPEFEEGGGYRILGRLNDQAPWIPFVTGWVSREDAIKYLRLAIGINARNFANRHFLAEALHRGDEKQQAEALELEEGIAADSPSPQRLVEDLTFQEAARQNLAAWKKAS
jgi:tetratricopeptide (TPR) repeat protein